MKKTIQIFVVLPVLFLLSIAITGCDAEKFYDQSLSLPGDNWPDDEALSFTVNIEDTASPYTFYINVRNSASYRYNNIYFFLTTTFPDGGMSRDTIECMLAARDGAWLGKGRGKYRDNRIWIRDNIHFPRKGEYKLSLNQAMREKVLPGISEAGVRLEKK